MFSFVQEKVSLAKPSRFEVSLEVSRTKEGVENSKGSINKTFSYTKINCIFFFSYIYIYIFDFIIIILLLSTPLP